MNTKAKAFQSNLTLKSISDKILMDTLIMLAENVERLSDDLSIAYSIEEFEKQAEQLKIYNQREKTIYEVFPEYLKEHLPHFVEGKSDIQDYWYYEFKEGLVTLRYGRGNFIDIIIGTNNYTKEQFHSQDIWQLLYVKKESSLNLLQENIDYCINTYKQKYKTVLDLVKVKNILNINYT